MLRLNGTLVLLCTYYGELDIYSRTFYLFRWLCARNKINRDIEFIILCKKFTHSFFKYFIGNPERNKPDHPDHVPSKFIYKLLEPSLLEKKIKIYEAVMKRKKAGANCSSKVSSNDNSKIGTPSTATAITTNYLDTKEILMGTFLKA